MNMKSKPEYYYNQSGVIPFRKSGEEVEILLITSRRRKRWVIPKGIIEADLSPSDSAEKEAYEEAGIKGSVYGDTIGRYKYNKWGAMCRVEVYLLKVTEELKDWPESYFRQRKWMTCNEAAAHVEEKSLKKIIKKVPGHLTSKS